MKRYKLREQAGADPQTYALGLKEVWEVCQQSHAVLTQRDSGVAADSGTNVFVVCFEPWPTSHHAFINQQRVPSKLHVVDERSCASEPGASCRYCQRSTSQAGSGTQWGIL